MSTCLVINGSALDAQDACLGETKCWVTLINDDTNCCINLKVALFCNVKCVVQLSIYVYEKHFIDFTSVQGAPKHSRCIRESRANYR